MADRGLRRPAVNVSEARDSFVKTGSGALGEKKSGPVKRDLFLEGKFSLKQV